MTYINTKTITHVNATRDQKKLVLSSTIEEPPSPSRWAWTRVLSLQWSLFWIFFDVAYYFFPDYLQNVYHISTQAQWGFADIFFENVIYSHLPDSLQNIIYYSAYFPYEALNYLFDHSLALMPTALLSSCSPHKYMVYIILAVIYDHGIYKILPSSIKNHLYTVTYFPYIIFNYFFTHAIYPFFPKPLKRLFERCGSYKDSMVQRLFSN